MHSLHELMTQVWSVPECLMLHLQAWHRGKTELPEKVAWVKGLPKADADWLRNLPWTIHIPDLKLVMVHGGLVPDVRAQTLS